MKSKILLVFAAFLAMTFFYSKANAQVDKMIGLWKTIDDDEDKGKAKSHIEIFKGTDGNYYGKIVKLLLKPQDTKCDNCTGSYKDKLLVGMVILVKMKADGDELTDGKIMDPNKGKWYNCTIEIDKDDPDKLNVRGSLDRWGLAGRTQEWFRLK